MIISKDKYSQTCDDCGKSYFNGPGQHSEQGYILKGEKNQVRIHLCKSCLKQLLSGNLEMGQGLKRSSSKLIKDYYPNVSISLTNKNNYSEALSNIAFAFSEEYRQKHKINNTGNAGAEEAIKKIIYNSKASGEELAKNLNKSKIGATNWSLYEDTDISITVVSKDPLGNEKYLNIRFLFSLNG